jgi:hypothetical protein
MKKPPDIGYLPFLSPDKPGPVRNPCDITQSLLQSRDTKTPASPL